MSAEPRQFNISDGVRREIPVLMAIVGASSSGKTFSALRIGTGIQRVSGGDLAVIDTDNKRALQYADYFKFKHIPFEPPFSPTDYLEAIRYASRYAKTVIVDHTSYEHEGPGGVLEWHARETENLAKRWKVSPEKAQMAAWGPPKTARREFIFEMTSRLNVNLILTFRAKEKVRMTKEGKPVDMGWQPIAGEEIMYEMMIQALLLPGSKGKPTWNPVLEAERAAIKVPIQFEDLFDPNDPKVLDEDAGEAIARWGAGGVAQDPLEGLVAEYAKCGNSKDLDALEKRRGEVWGKVKGEIKQRLKDASDGAKRRFTSSVARISMDQATLLADALKEEGVALSLLLGKFEIGALEELPSGQYAEAKAFIEATSAGS
jgi:hypothetical protein